MAKFVIRGRGVAKFVFCRKICNGEEGGLQNLKPGEGSWGSQIFPDLPLPMTLNGIALNYFEVW